MVENDYWARQLSKRQCVTACYSFLPPKQVVSLQMLNKRHYNVIIPQFLYLVLMKPVLLVSCRYSSLTVYNLRTQIKTTSDVAELSDSGRFAFSIILNNKLVCTGGLLCWYDDKKDPCPVPQYKGCIIIEDLTNVQPSQIHKRGAFLHKERSQHS